MKVKLKEEFFNEKDQLIEDLNQRKEVEYAEPNYIFSIEDYKIESDIISEEEALNTKKKITQKQKMLSNRMILYLIIKTILLD